MTRNRPKTLLIFLAASLSLLYLAGCTGINAGQPDPTATAAVQTTFTPVPPTPDILPTEQPSATPLPSLTPTAEGCTENEGRIEAGELSDPALSRPLSYRVYLPPCYDAARPEGYPVVFLLHGQSMTETIWEEMGIQETADRLIRDKETVPFLIVMPREEYFLQEFKESEFDKALIEALLPTAAENYNISSERACRAIGGISRGASWAMLLGWVDWEDFGAIGAHSVPNAPFSSSRLRTLKEGIPSGDLPRILIDIGESDRYFKGAQQLHALLGQLDIPHEWQVEAGAHNTDYWQAYLEAYLRWYAAGWESCDTNLP